MGLVYLCREYPSLLHPVTTLENSILASLKVEFSPVFLTKEQKTKNAFDLLFKSLISIKISLVIFLPLGISAKVYFNGRL